MNELRAQRANSTVVLYALLTTMTAYASCELTDSQQIVGRFWDVSDMMLRPEIHDVH